MRKRTVFTRADILKYFRQVYCTGLASDEKVTIGPIVRLKNVSPPVWVVDYDRHTGIGSRYSVFHSKSIIVAAKDFHGNPVLRLAETEILPEEAQE